MSISSRKFGNSVLSNARTLNSSNDEVSEFLHGAVFTLVCLNTIAIIGMQSIVQGQALLL